MAFMSRSYRVVSLEWVFFYALMLTVLFVAPTMSIAQNSSTEQATKIINTIQKNVHNAKKEQEETKRIEFNDLKELSRLISTNQINSAQKLLDQIEQKAAGRPDVEFYKGVLLAEQGKASEAITVYQRLSQSFPEMPEAHNNLGVLFASLGFLDQAREYFLKAITSFPSYAIAHENLADIYVRLADSSYQNAKTYTTQNQTLNNKQEDLNSFVLKHEIVPPLLK